jgi:hypothetical protein
MRLFIRKGRSSHPVVVCPAQQFVDSEDFMIAMRRHVRSGGNVYNMYVDFENTQIPVTHISEIRVLSQMAAAYHNACLAQNLSGEKDLYGMPYDAVKWPEIKGVSFKTEEDNAALPAIVRDNDGGTWSAIVTNKQSGNMKVKNTNKKKESKQMEWDEELHGERVVFDSTFEINEDLVPWLMNPKKWEEKYGMY